MTQPDNLIPQDAISVSENPNPAVTALSVIAEKTQQDWEDELAGPYTTKINPLLTWVTNLDLTEILQRLGALDGVEALIAAFQDALEPLLDPLTAALLNCNGSNNSTVIDDQSPLNANWTCAGNAKLSTAVKKYGESSLLLDGSGDYIYPTAPASSFAWGQSDFTIEMWAYTTSVGTLQTLYDSGGGLSPRLQFSNSKLIYSVNGQVAIQGTTTLSGSTWYHVAVSREGDTTRLFLNGQQEGPDWTDETNYVNTANRPRIGLNVDGIHGFVGNIDSIRLTRLCRYTENFTPPAAQFTQSLLSYLGEIVENLGRVTFTAGASILDFLVTDIGVALVETIMSGLQVVAAVGNGVFNVIAEILQWFFDQPGVEGAVAVFNDVLTFFADIIEQVGGLSLWNDGLAAVTALLQLVGNIVGQTFESVNNALEYFADEGTFIGQLAANITGIALNLISDPFDAIANWADTLPPLFDTVTVAILNGNGANNTTVIDDQSPLNADWDAKGNTKISTAVKKYGTGSMLFDGTGDYIEPTTALSSFAWGNRDFTIEMWIYRTSLNANEMLWDAGASALKVDANKLVWVVDGQTRIQGATNLNINTWYHVAVCRSGTQTRLWLNGNLQGSVWTDATDYSAQSVRIGLSATGTLGFTGNIDSVRLTKGLARYPNRFTPPSAEFLPAILNNIPIIGPILEGITGIVGAGLQDLIDFFDGITGGAGSFLAQLVSAITGDAIELITAPLDALGTFFNKLPEVFEFFSGVIESVFDALDVTIERVIDVFKAVVEIIVGLFAGFPDFAAMLTYLRNSLLRILAAIGIISGEDAAEFSLQMIFDGIVDFFENIPLIGPIITALTGGATLDGKPVTDLGMLAQWFFQNVLRIDSLLPADNLRGVLPWFLLPKIPVGHIDGSTPNLLEQTGFTQAAVMQQGGRWSWDANIGSGAAKVTAASAAAFLYSNAVSVSEGQQFTISAQVQYSNLAWNPLASPVMLGLRLYNDGQIVQSNQPVVYAPSIGLGTQNFFLLTGNYTIPAGVDTVRMSLGVTQSASSGTVWFDDVVMRKTGLLDQGLVGELINAWNGLVDGLNGSQQGTSNLAEGTGPGLFNPSSGVRQAASTAYSTATAAQTAASSAQTTANTAANAASSAQTAADTANTILETKSSAGTNLMLSPTFASTSITRIPYPLNATGTQGYSTEQSRSGVRSWKWLQPVGQDRGLYLAPTQTGRTYAVKAGEKYFLEAFLYPDAPGAVSGTVTLGATYTVSKTGATSTSNQTVNIPTKGQWNQLNREVTIPAGVDLAEFYVYTTSSTASLALYVDDVTVREVTDAKAAQAAAETAASAASTAQNTANTAQNAANTAQNTANTAQNTANTAQNTANSANTAATNAQTTANSANTAATNAQNTANSANTAASNAQNSANTANTGVQTTLNNVTRGLQGFLLGNSNATGANAEEAARLTREALSSMQSKVASLQAAASTNSYSGRAFFEDFSSYAASANGLGSSWSSVQYTSTGTNTGTVGIETATGVARAAWIGQTLDKRRGLVFYNTPLGTGNDADINVLSANDYQKVGVVLSSGLTLGTNYIYARSNTTGSTSVYAKLWIPALFGQASVEIWSVVSGAASKLGSTQTFTFSAGSTYWLECGSTSSARQFRVYRDNTPIHNATGTTTNHKLPSEFGSTQASSYRYVGFGLESTADAVFRWEPADVAGFAAFDNKPAPTLGSGFRIARTNTAVVPIATNPPLYQAGAREITGQGAIWGANPSLQTSDLTWNGTTGRVTVSVAGWYLVDVGLTLSNILPGNSTFAAACFKNGAIHSEGHQQWGTSVASFGRRAAGSWLVYCNKDDQLSPGFRSSFDINNGLGTPGFVGEATGSQTYFSVTFVGNSKPVQPT